MNVARLFVPVCSTLRAGPVPWLLIVNADVVSTNVSSVVVVPLTVKSP